MAVTLDSGRIDAFCSDAHTAVSSTTVTSASNPWVPGDVGSVICLFKGGPSTTKLYTTISGYTGPGEITIADQASSLATDYAQWYIGGAHLSSAAEPQISITSKHTTSGTNRYLVVKVWYTPTTAADNLAATYDGQAMTLLDKYFQSGSRGIAIFGLALEGVVATGEHDVVVYDTTSTAQTFAFLSASYNGVDQTTPAGTPAHTGGSGTGTISVTVSSASGELVVDAVASYYSADALTATGTGQTLTEDFRSSIGAGSKFSGTNGQIIGSTTPGAASTVVSYSHSITDYWSIIGIPLKPAATGGSISATRVYSP